MPLSEIEQRLLKSNELLRSAYQIASRNGKDTNWATFRDKLMKELESQHNTINLLREKDQT